MMQNILSVLLSRLLKLCFWLLELLTCAPSCSRGKGSFWITCAGSSSATSIIGTIFVLCFNVDDHSGALAYLGYIDRDDLSIFR
ncbi:hypothetical protein BJ165DRAFT_1468051 [Panaeolus papilionaceus]|nr:hypothetical protein BJ165DRAFT_1468051 [Panaeolus papilionaceus]